MASPQEACRSPSHHVRYLSEMCCNLLEIISDVASVPNSHQMKFDANEYCPLSPLSIIHAFHFGFLCNWPSELQSSVPEMLLGLERCHQLSCSWSVSTFSCPESVCCLHFSFFVNVNCSFFHPCWWFNFLCLSFRMSFHSIDIYLGETTKWHLSAEGTHFHAVRWFLIPHELHCGLLNASWKNVTANWLIHTLLNTGREGHLTFGNTTCWQANFMWKWKRELHHTEMHEKDLEINSQGCNICTPDRFLRIFWDREQQYFVVVWIINGKCIKIKHIFSKIAVGYNLWNGNISS